MELSSDNIEELAKVLTSDTSHQNDVFQMKADLSTLDVDRVISDTQDSLLKTSLEAIRSCDGPCSFNDILDDICKMNTNIELQQAAVGNPLPLEPPAFYHMPDLEMQPHDYSSECSFSNQTDFLQPLGGQWSEFLPLPPSALSTIQDIPQLAPIPMARPATPIPEPVTIPQKVVDEEIPTITQNSIIEEKQLDTPAVSVAMATPPLQFFNNYQYTIPPGLLNTHSMQQIEMPNTSLQFAQCPDGNINFMVLPEQPPIMQPSMGALGGPPCNQVVQQQQAPFFDWARVVPRRAFIQPSEIVVLRPLRTRKVMSSRPTFDLASYFDTSSISIPMIRERPRPRTHRRKQKLYTIPGADNLVFEVQLGYNKDDNNNNNDDDDQLYPETEIPELDEIFKRKRRALNPKRNPQTQDHIKAPLSPSQPHVKDPIETKDEDSTPSPIQEHQEPDESYSDVDSDDAPLTAVKSMKCLNCRKIFKTCRSLTIHSKRCKVIRQQSPKMNGELDNFAVAPEALKLSRAPRKVHTPPPSLSQAVCSTTKADADLKTPNGVGRPLTRSQTRRALKRKLTSYTEDDDIDGVGAQKLSK